MGQKSHEMSFDHSPNPDGGLDRAVGSVRSWRTDVSAVGVWPSCRPRVLMGFYFPQGGQAARDSLREVARNRQRSPTLCR